MSKIKYSYKNNNYTIKEQIALINKHNKIKRKHLAKSTHQNGKIGIKYGDGIIRIGSLNVINLRNYESIESVMQLSLTNNIDIACIQETHTVKTILQLAMNTIQFSPDDVILIKTYLITKLHIVLG